VIVDELHEQDDRELIDTLQSSMVSANRPQSLMIYLTTADYDRPSVCNEKYEHAVKVRDKPEKDPALLPVIFEASPKDDPYDPATWRKANPNLGISVGEEELAREAEKAKDNPAYAVEFKRLFLNLRTRQVVDHAIDIALWSACSSPVDPEALAGRACWAGMDFGWRDDFAAVVLVFPDASGNVDVLPYFWLPEDGKRDQRAMPVASFIASRQVILTSGNATDIEAMYDVLRQAREKYDLRTIAYDPANARKQGQDLMAEGFKVVEFYQSKRNYSEPWKWLMADGLKAKKLRHGGHPVLEWMAGNTCVEVDGLDGVMPKKKRSAEKIDGICAMCMGLGAWLIDPDKGASVYEERGLQTIGGDDDEEGERLEGETDEAEEFQPIDWSKRIWADEDDD
jgi:phage terminase large subunit-like protein